VQSTRDGQAKVRYSVTEQSRGRVTPCEVCTVHIEIKSVSFLIEPQNQGQWFDLKITWTVCQWFGLKTTGTIFSGLALKPVAMVFSGLASKSVAQVS
jgi:hypothetical protein